MGDIHENIVKYIKFMKARRVLKDFEDTESCYFFNSIKKYYFHCRPVLFSILLVLNVIGLYGTGDFGMSDGTSLFLPLSISTVVLGSSLYAKVPDHSKLIDTLNKHFLQRREPWMVQTKKKYVSSVWKFVKWVKIYQKFSFWSYTVVALAMDTILHYGFDWLRSPLFLPLTFSPFLGADVTWDTKYYVIMVLDGWAAWEFIETLQGFIVSYAVTNVYCLSELTVFREKITNLDLEGSGEEIYRELVMIVNWHDDIIALNRDLKAFLGLPCAFQTLFTSLTLTLTLFTTFTSTEIPVVMAYGSGFMFYFAAGLLYCSLGQLLENESEEVFRALYNLPWYRYSPAVRKDFIMMMRQARTPLIIDFHGRSKMNLANFMQILRQAYSYFTLLQSVTEK